MWGRGNYAKVARRLEPIARELVAAAEVRPGDRVLDAAAGTGNVALAALERGAEVTAYDLSPELVRQGKARASQSGRHAVWVEADAQSLPFADGHFDRVLSAFGIMYAPEPRRAAGEALRCLAPGGTVATTAWSAESFSAESTRVVAKAMGSSGGASTEAWADQAFLRTIFEGREIRVTEHVLLSEFESPEHWWAQARDSSPPLVAVREKVGKAAFEALGKQLSAVAVRFNDSKGPGLLLRQEYKIAIIK